MPEKLLGVLGMCGHHRKTIGALSSKYGWQPYSYIKGIREASDTRLHARVGLIIVDRQDACNPQKIKLLMQTLSGSRLYWLALLNSEITNSDTALNCMLDRYCQRILMLPTPIERLHTLLADIHSLHQWQRADAADQKLKPDNAMAVIASQQSGGKLIERINRFADVDAPILISGETGTGKELTAQAIHQASRRAQGPFIAVNCGALPQGLAQSELYGYEKGAFTGAYERRKGYIEAASGGTLFLDEIGDLPLAIQVTLLRFLESQRMTRVGGRKDFHADVRIIAASHIDLRQAVSEKTFRGDLYHRLNVLDINLPPLRERKPDIEPLARFFLHKFNDECSCRLQDISQEALGVMRRHAWPGNIRELMNRIRSAIFYSDSALLMPADMGLEQRYQERHITSLEKVRSQAEYKALREALRNNSYNLGRVASELMISKITLYRLIEKHGLKLS